MDTSRIVINIIDQSTSLIENPTAITGFTVVKAPKGPTTPVRVVSGSAAAIKDLFGESSQEYPELFEVETFNREYDLWVSAPYEKATVPVAYITDDGIVLGEKNVDYEADKLEAIVLGEKDVELDGISISGLNTNLSSSKALYDTRYPLSQKAFEKYADVVGTGSATNPQYKAADLNTATYGHPSFKDNTVVVNLGVPLNFFVKDNTNWVPENNTIKILGFDDKYYSEYTISQGTLSNGKVTFNVYPTGKESEIIGTITGNYSGSYDYKNLDLVITGKDNSSDKKVIATEYIKTYFNTDLELENLSVFYVKTLTESKVHGAILPKFPSERALHIDFNAFSELKGYSAKSYLSRNILKMDVYEDGAFHDDSHKIHVEGSLNLTDRDANGGKIGFSFENGTYSSQNLVYVFSFNPFDSTSTFNKNITKYPSITLAGGTREFYKYKKSTDTAAVANKEYFEQIKTAHGVDIYKKTTFSSGNVYERDSTDIDLHDYGWEMSEQGDYTDVDIFFNSSLSHDTSWSSSKFYSLAKVDKVNHKLAGYYFNKTLSPDEVDSATVSDQLSFGRNYWNIDNEALITLENGSRILSPLTGAMSVMECRILENRYGGVAPMWENQGTPSMGGQLNSVVDIYKLKYRYTKAQLDILDDLNFNPVVNDRQYGFMVVGQKTCQPGEITDWSYIGHAAAFLNFLKEVRTNVMIPQLGKANNPYYRTLRKEQVERYLARRLEGTNRIWAYAEVDTSTADGCNDVYARKAKKFIINVKVMVDTFSEKVELNFTNLDQEATVNFG